MRLTAEFADLRARFEADKAKVAKLKATRRFKPCVAQREGC